MTIYNLAVPFLKSYKATDAYYHEYFDLHSEIYDYYFYHHCLNKEQKLQKALLEHPNKLGEMKWIAERIEAIIPTTMEKYEQLFPIQFTKGAYLFVGLGGSNAYTYLSMDPHIAFCVEKFEQNEDALRVIVAHEFGHAVHHLFTTYHKIEASRIDWSSPYTWLLQEGVATYLSTLITDVEQDVYFAYKRDPSWLRFCEDHTKEILEAFLYDLNKLTSQQLFKEWFSINGGETFNASRLGYYLSYLLVKDLVEEFGLNDALIYWQNNDFKAKMHERLTKHLWRSHKS